MAMLSAGAPRTMPIRVLGFDMEGKSPFYDGPDISANFVTFCAYSGYNRHADPRPGSEIRPAYADSLANISRRRSGIACARHRRQYRNLFPCRPPTSAASAGEEPA